MAKSLIENIVNDFKSLGKSVILAENPDKFLLRADVFDALLQNDIHIISSKHIVQRIEFELRNDRHQNDIIVLLSDDNTNYLEDIIQVSVPFNFHFSKYLNGYHIPSVINCELEIIEQLYKEEPIVSLNKKETLSLINSFKEKTKISEIDIDKFKNEIDELVNQHRKDWQQIISILSSAVLNTIGTGQYEEVLTTVQGVNSTFQEELETNYKQLVNSSPIKRPLIVSKIQGHLKHVGRNKKLALIVVDGMSFWQYKLISSSFPMSFKLEEEITYSWIPSITQLSRQAIFKGDTPDRNYRQNPINESNLWKAYWKHNGFSDYKILYQHNKKELKDIERVSRLAIVYTDLDDKMHSSTDYRDLKSLTKHWIDRSGIVNTIQKLLENEFIVYLTTDHGNIPAKGWRGLKGKEKLGTQKSGSRSQRHLEYSEQWLADEFIESNEELEKSIVQEDKVLYFKDNLSFSNEPNLVTHGGSNLLEVIIPFIRISK